jgi:hypothetical protein
MDSDKDFLPANRVAFKISAESDWQTHEVQLPTHGKVIHLRVHLPSGSIEIRQLELRDAAGKPVLSLKP